MVNENQCIICNTPSTLQSNITDFSTTCLCPICGTYRISEMYALAFKEQIDEKRLNNYLSFQVRNWERTKANSVVKIPESLYKDILEENRWFNVSELSRNLIDYLGKNTGIGRSVMHTLSEWSSIIGAKDSEETKFIIYNVLNQHIGIDNEPRGLHIISLTPKGWERFEELKKEKPQTNKAFMAMKFDNAALDMTYKERFAPIVKAAGFDLKRVDAQDEIQSGLITQRMIAQIRNSRFLIADLSLQNNGVYWEAGFATGLDIPVFYVIEEKEFEKRHFDIYQHLIIQYSFDESSKHYVDKACLNLWAAIYNTVRAGNPPPDAPYSFLPLPQ
jgi:nucleoside 2-deoxyribosyltransferase